MFQLIIITDLYCNVQRMILLRVQVRGIGATKIFTPMHLWLHAATPVLSFAFFPDAWSSSSVARFILTETFVRSSLDDGCWSAQVTGVSHVSVGGAKSVA